MSSITTPRSKSTVVLLAAIMLLALAGAVSTRALVPCFAGEAPRIVVPDDWFTKHVGEGLAGLMVYDVDVYNGQNVECFGCVTLATVIEPDGSAIVLSDPNCGAADRPSIWGWTSRMPGEHLLLLEFDDCGCSDEPNDVALLSFTVESCGGCGSGMTCGKCLRTVKGRYNAYLQFSLGHATDGDSAGHLAVTLDEPRPEFCQPASLEYGIVRDDIEVIYQTPGDPSTPLRQILTPQLLADIVVTSAYAYEIRYFALDDVGSKSNGVYQVTAGDAYRKWVIENPTGDPNDYDVLKVTEYADNGAGSLAVRGYYEYAGTYASGAWTLTTKDASETALRVEEVTLEAIGGGVRRHYVVTEPTSEVYVEHEDYKNIGGNYRRAQRVVDPNGAALTTNWDYEDPNDGFFLDWVEQPGGGWTWYDASRDPNGYWVVKAFSGIKDDTRPGAFPSESSVRAEIRTFAGEENRPSKREVKLLGNRIRTAEWTYALDPNDNTLISSTREQWLDAAGTNKLTTTTGYWNGDQERFDYVVFPDGRRTDWDYDDTISFSAGSLPGTPPSYNTGGDDGKGYRYREVVQGYDNSGSLALVDGKSTKTVTIVDAGGWPVFQETYAYNNGWTRIDWTAHTYDQQQRLTGTYTQNGANTTIAYDSCCEKTVTDSTSVETTYEYDVLGRLLSVTRASIASYGTYASQPEAVTNYIYNPREITVTTSSSGLTDTSVRTYDKARRITSITFANDTLKRIYEYGDPNEAQPLDVSEWVKEANPQQPISFTPADQRTTRYRDGRTKSITGVSVVDTHYDYGWDATEEMAYARVATGDPNSPRYQITYYDVLGRTAKVVRPAWGGSSTVATVNTYDTSTGLLMKVEQTGRADTLYAYDALANVVQTAIDVNDNGQIDTGGADRITESESTYEQAAGQWWRVGRSWVYATDSSSTKTATGSTWTRLTGFSGGEISETQSLDALGNATVTTVTIDPNNALRTVSTLYPDGDPNFPAQQVYHGGRLMTSISRTNVATSYTYDALGRRTHVTDGRGNVTQTVYNTAGQVQETIHDPSGEVWTTTYTYYGGDTPSPGRVASITNALGKVTYYEYNGRGQTANVWGHVPYPTLTEYDDYGARVKLTTFRDGVTHDFTATSWPGATESDGDTTTWTYDAATGLLDRKTYADGTYVDYTYRTDGKLETRTWARGVETTYGYDSATGELISVNYDTDDPNDPNTPEVQISYDRMGRRAQVIDAAGTRTFGYDPNSLQLQTESFTSGLLSGLILSQVVEDSAGVPGRFAGVEVGTSGDPDAYYGAYYEYDAYGRMIRVTGPGLPTGGSVNHGAWYAYETGSDLVDTIEFRSGNYGVLWGESLRTFESERDLLDSVDNRYRRGQQTDVRLALYDYVHDDVGARSHVANSGPAFDAAAFTLYGYNDRHELTASQRYLGSDPNSPDPNSIVNNQYLAFSYDPIGNRQTYKQGAAAGDPNMVYTTNVLNQYEQGRVADEPDMALLPQYDDDGNLTRLGAAGDLNCDGVVDFFDIDAWDEALEGKAAFEAAYPGCNWYAADLDGDGDVDLDDEDLFLDRLGVSVMTATYVWDADNRLAAVVPDRLTTGARKLVFAYDYQGRRVRKSVYTYDAGWSLSSDTAFVYDGWKLLLELDVSDPNAITIMRRYSWGLDLAGQGGAVNSLEAAGTISGLLAMNDPADDPNDVARDYVYFHDASGNVTQLVDLAADPNAVLADPTAAIVVHYEYGPYGRRVNADPNSPDAYDQPFGFSGKYWDTETGMGYWGRRYYHPALGRWISRDPIGEAGGVNVYAYVGNNPVSRHDGLGLHVECRIASGNCDIPSATSGPSPTTGPATTGPASQPSATQPTQPATPCERSLHQAKEANKDLIDWLKNKSCYKDVRCLAPTDPRCKDIKPGDEGAFTPADGSGPTEVCANTTVTPELLRHELIHQIQNCPAYDNSAVQPDDDGRIGVFELICREIQAVTCSGECRKDNKVDQSCVKTRCTEIVRQKCQNGAFGPEVVKDPGCVKFAPAACDMVLEDPACKECPPVPGMIE